MRFALAGHRARRNPRQLSLGFGQPWPSTVAFLAVGTSRITPGDHTKSLVWLVAHLRDGLYQMPPLVSHKIDDDGTQMLADWIDALPPN